MKKISSSATSIALAVGLVVAFGGGVAMAKGHGPEKHHGPTNTSSFGYGYGNPHKPVGQALSGSATCTVHGTLVLTSSGSMKLTGNLTGKRGAPCTTTSGKKIRVGHISKPLVFTSTSTSTAACTSVPTTVGDLTGGNIAWTPGPKIAPSVGVTFTGGTASTVSVNGRQFLQIAYTGGSVASGSFANASGGALTLTSRQTVTQLQERCSSGRTVIAFTGTVTL